VQPVDLAAHADDFDREIAVTPAIDRFCSSSAWILAAAAALMPARAPFSFRGEHGYLAAARGVHPAGFPYIEPIELAWGLASPLVGRDPQGLAEEVVPVLAARRDWQLAILAGMTADGPQRIALERALPGHWERRRGQPTTRHVASLTGGIDGFLSRRSRDLRKSLRRSLRAAVDQHVTFESVRVGPDGATTLYERIQIVEATSWKAREGVGISTGSMRAFYGHMLPRLCQLGQQRTLFARRDDRGLQVSYDDDHADLGLGGLLQYHQILELCAEGIARYDLGTEMDYKRRWAEDVMETEMLVLVR
jgi:hypothetical protein